MSHKIIFIANNNIGYGLSGGDTIFIELLHHWQSNNKITLIACQEAINILPTSITKIKIIKTDSINNNPNNNLLNLLLHYVRRIYFGVRTIKNKKKQLKNNDYVYSVSDFLPDLLPALYLKILYPKIKWIVGFYLFAPFPFAQNSPYTGINRIKGFIYWFIQLITKTIVSLFADIVFITSVPDIKHFSKNNKIIVIRGGVNLSEINKYKKNHPILPISKRKYDGCFMGRFHPQKGCLELIKIWQQVVSKIPSAKLAIIGQGEMESKMKQLINKYNLTKNITFFGFQNGKPKYDIFTNSKVIIHPATYDSGGMASAEAMAFGLPGVSFDLEALKTYYPKGFIKTKCFSNKIFAQNIIKLLKHKDVYVKLSQESKNLIQSHWDWAKRSQEIYNEI